LKSFTSRGGFGDYYFCTAAKKQLFPHCGLGIIISAPRLAKPNYYTADALEGLACFSTMTNDAKKSCFYGRMEFLA
jgi:hypothetical protein